MAKATLSWNEMRDRAYAFVREWKDETSEKAEAQSFWTEWFDIFCLKRRCTLAFEQADWPRCVMSSDFQNFLVLDLETSEKTAFPLTELPQHLELFGWIAGYQRRSFAVEDEVNAHAA